MSEPTPFDPAPLQALIDDIEYRGAPPEMVEQLRGLIAAEDLRKRQEGIRRASFQINDYQGVTGEFPEVGRGIQTWVADPVPKFDGLTITLRWGPYARDFVEMILERDDGDRRWTETRMLSRTELEAHRDPAMHVFEALDIMHRRIIDAVRARARWDPR